MASLPRPAFANSQRAAASAASRSAWRLPPKLPTISTDVSTAYLTSWLPEFPTHRRSFANETFVVHARPITLLKRNPAPFSKGPNILRAFLWARENFPDVNFMEVKERALEALYNSHRVDRLPRVIFGVSKDVKTRVDGRVQLAGVLRHRIKRRARQAFREALEAKRKITPAFRLDVDLLFLIRPKTLLLPYSKLVDDMHEMINTGFWAIVHRQGYRCARASQRFLNPDTLLDPPHILTLLAEKLQVREFESEEEKLGVYQQLKEEEAHLPELIDLNKLAESMVKGVESKMRVLQDGTMQIVSGSEHIPVMQVGDRAYDRTDSRHKVDTAQMPGPDGKELPWTRAMPLEEMETAENSEPRDPATFQFPHPAVAGDRRRGPKAPVIGQAGQDRRQRLNVPGSGEVNQPESQQPLKKPVETPGDQDRRQRLKAQVMEQVVNHRSQSRVTHPMVVDGEWVFPEPNRRRQRLRDMAPLRDTLDDPRRPPARRGGTSRDREPTHPKNLRTRIPDVTGYESTARDEASYGRASFDWLFDPKPQDSVDNTQPRSSTSQPWTESVPKFQWTPQEREAEFAEEESEEYWDGGEEDLRALEGELEKLFPDQVEEKDWGLDDLDGIEDFGKRRAGIGEGRNPTDRLGR